MLLSFGGLLRRALGLLVLADVVLSQAIPDENPSPFSFVGTIDSMSLDPGGDILAGGTITVNGFKIIIPKNLLVTLPSISCAWEEMFDDDTGEPNLPMLGTVSWEATVFGNIVNGQRIAGLVYIFQQSTQFLQGFITSINYTNGHLIIDNEVEVVLNDPLGRFGHVYTVNPLWTVDTDDISVYATTGFPLCVPRNSTDAECPLTNRPTDGNGNYLTSFTFPDPALVTEGGPDPRIMAPLVVGDYVTFSGIKTADGVLEIYELEANLGFYTAPGTQPAYVVAVAAQYAIVNPDPTLETDETRATAMATDASITLNWFAIDVDPCTGAETERNLQLVEPSEGAPVGRATFRLGKTDASPVTREVGFRYSNGVVPGPRGIIAGQYIQPIFTYVFPELVAFGDPEPVNQFDLFPYLAMGSGPFVYGNYLEVPPATPTTVGQLSPWPGNIPPGTTSCPPPSTSTGTATASSASSTSTAKPDIIIILSATTRNQKGETMTSVTALTSSLTAQLYMAIIGADAVLPQLMISLGNGQWALTITTKGKPTSVQVTSTENGTPAIVAV
ncbi:hypothetical protein C8R44DRAFT_656035 [Mycena epipterygia]|nr:hypothetical protein C8R44DRAFT_656035 [Mycena epipterygia]